MKSIMLAAIMATHGAPQEGTLTYPSDRVVDIRGDIEDTTTVPAIAKLKELQAVRGKPIYIFISSHGGYVHLGEMINREIYKHQTLGNEVVCVAVGPVLSMALYIYDNCDKRYATKNATFLWHHIIATYMRPAPIPALLADLEVSLATQTKIFRQLREHLGMDEEVFTRHAFAETIWPAEALKEVAPDYFTIIRTVRPK